MLAAAIGLSATAWGATPGQPNGKASPIKGVSAITEVFGDGQRTTAVAVEYDKNIASGKLSTAAFAVEGRTITKVYASQKADKAAQGSDGRYVILELSPDDKDAPTFTRFEDHGGPGGPSGPGAPAAAGGKRIQPMGRKLIRKKVEIVVKQVGEIETVSGVKIAAQAHAVKSSKVVNLVVDDFQKLVFKDPENGNTIKYNLFVPKNYDKSKSYPLVMFIHDASVLSDDYEQTLIQGNGAAIWATPAEQAKHPSFVLAPQLDEVVSTDSKNPSNMLDSVAHLIFVLEKQYSINTGQIYTMGQSLGTMMSIALNAKYPDLFAASLLVAGQGEPDLMGSLAHKNLWFIISEGDMRAYPATSASLPVMEKAGAKVCQARWNAKASPTEQAENVKWMIDQECNIKVAYYIKGTTLPVGQENSGANEHMETWNVAYSIEGVRDWLFTQKKAH
jgi:predicted peptidase